METADAWLRWTRASALAVVASLVAVWAHAGGGGHLPPAHVLLAVVGALTLAAAPLLARPASAVRVVVLTVGGQALAHAALSLLGGHHGHPSHGVAGSATAPPATDPVAYLLGDLATAGAPMLLSHLAAAAAVGAWLAGGERAVWTLLTLAWRALALCRPVLPATAVLRRAATPVAVPTLLVRVATGSVVRRGPPLLLPA